MAIGPGIGGNIGTRTGGNMVEVISPRTDLYVINTALTTAQGSGDDETPAAVDDAGFNWFFVGSASSFRVRGRYSVGITSVGTDPVVEIFGAVPSGDFEYPELVGASGSFSSTVGATNYAEMMRLDNADNAGAGITLATDNTNDLRDNTWKYTDFASLTSIDMQGCPFIGVLCTTAAATFGGSGSTFQAQVQLL